MIRSQHETGATPDMQIFAAYYADAAQRRHRRPR